MPRNIVENLNAPLVSVITPFYNRESFLGEAVKSVLDQRTQSWELLLIDDGSTDGSVEIANAFAKDYPSRIRVLSHEDNLNKGAGASRHLGIVKSRGRYLTFLDSDDVFLPHTLERELEVFEKHPDADVVCGTSECWFSWSDNARWRDKDFTVSHVFETEKLYHPPELLLQNMMSRGRKPGTNSVMLKSEFARAAGVFKEDFIHIAEDQVTWAKITLNGKIYVIDEVLSKYRQHPESICAVERSNGQDSHSMRFYFDWLENYLRKQELEDKVIWKSLRRYRREVNLATKLKFLKQVYRRLLPLHLRYRFRDRLTQTSRFLSRFFSNRNK